MKKALVFLSIAVALASTSTFMALAENTRGQIRLGKPAARSELASPALQADPPYVQFLPAIAKQPAVTLQADRQQLRLGETVLLTATVNFNAIGCQYPVLDITLIEMEPGQVEFISPQVVLTPGRDPVTYEVRPLQSGAINLRAQSFGEINCEGFWVWRYYSSRWLELQVQP